ncbi:resistant to dieldrin isoform X7 [Osmia lignaria lignaria]|uniref:resistant to dieldrin isoform X7 n=1 Tax=Osmia lignaria lignaria TaxID=1437193 RepID=UPI00402BDE60
MNTKVTICHCHRITTTTTTTTTTTNHHYHNTKPLAPFEIKIYKPPTYSTEPRVRGRSKGRRRPAPKEAKTQKTTCRLRCDRIKTHCASSPAHVKNETTAAFSHEVTPWPHPPPTPFVGYTMRDIRYKWNAGLQSVGISNEVELPQFRVLGHRQRHSTIHLSTGNYSRLACEIQFVRSMGYYLIQIYIPSGLIVIISWVSFWLNRNATPARVALGVTTVLTMTTLMSSTNAALPKISYVKSIDVYLGTCFVMVFASLLEYATVGYMAKRIQMRKNRFQKIAESMKTARENPGPPGVPGDHGDHAPKQTWSRVVQEVRFKVHDPKAHSKGGTLENTINGRADEEAAPAPQHLIHPGKDISKLYGMTPSDIDKYSRIVFPVCFVCFNLMYWIIYLHISDVVADDLVLLEEAK